MCHNALYWNRFYLYMTVASGKQLVNTSIVSINSINSESVYIKQFLSVHVDYQLDWNGHIKSIKTKGVAHE